MSMMCSGIETWMTSHANVAHADVAHADIAPCV